MFIDYYSILEIAQSASKVEIKSAYKRQAIKWHPDKNIGQDTTEKMQKINEAYLILNDDEARLRYNVEFDRFINFQNAKKQAAEQKRQEKKKYEQSQNQQSKQREEEQKHERTEEKSYKFDDEILKRWMENAKKQAAANIKDMIIEFRDSSIIGFSTFLKRALASIISVFIFSVLATIIFKSCG